MRAVTGSQILILQLAVFAFSFQLTACVTVPCLWFPYPMSLFKYYKRVEISDSLPDPKGQRIIMVVCITCMTTYCSTSSMQLAQTSLACRCGILWSHRIYSNNDSTLDSTLQAINIVHDDFTRPHNLVKGLLCKYNNRRYYCRAEKLMLRRNWASQTKSAIWYWNQNHLAITEPDIHGTYLITILSEAVLKQVHISTFPLMWCMSALCTWQLF